MTEPPLLAPLPRPRHSSGALGRIFITMLCVPYFVLRRLASDVVRGRNPLEHYRQYRANRGISVVRDWVDWLGGYPFEVATPTTTFDFLRARGFRSVEISRSSSGCNEFVFTRERDATPGRDSLR